MLGAGQSEGGNAEVKENDTDQLGGMQSEKKKRNGDRRWVIIVDRMSGRREG